MHIAEIIRLYIMTQVVTRESAKKMENVEHHKEKKEKHQLLKVKMLKLI